jgi:hypothetical protein
VNRKDWFSLQWIRQSRFWRSWVESTHATFAALRRLLNPNRPRCWLGRSSPQKHTFLPTFEQLEVRTVPSIIGAAQLVDDPVNAFSTPIGEASVFPGSGAVSISQPLDLDLRSAPVGAPLGATSLVYNSGAADGLPIIQVEASGGPSTITLELIWDSAGTSPQTVSSTFTPSGTAGMAIQVTTPISVAGVYDWKIEELDSTSTVLDTATGVASVFPENNSPFGAGWGVAGIDQLVTSHNDVLWCTGTGQTRLFAPSGTSGLFTNSQDFGTLSETTASLTAR